MKIETNPVRVFIGFDPREEVALHVLSRSIWEHASLPVSITPIRLSQLEGVFTREREPLQSTEFSFSRFLTPWLCGYEGWALFTDCDMLMLDDIARLWAVRNERYAVMCVKHDHRPTEDTKFLGEVQTRYQKKNWSSVMLFNCAKCTALTPEYVNTASGLELHRFEWLGDDGLIGEIPDTWNRLVGHQAPRDGMSLVPHTIVGHYLHEYADCEYATEWNRECEGMLHCEQRGETLEG